MLLGEAMDVAPPGVVGALRVLLDGSRTHGQQRRVGVAIELFRRQYCVQTVETAKHLLPVWRQLQILAAYCFADSQTSQETPGANQLKEF